MMTTLLQIPYDFKLAKYSGKEGGYSIELHYDGEYGSGTSNVSLNEAYSKAESELLSKLQRPHPVEETQDYFLVGTWLG